jgi:hypothetical protein
MRISKVFLSVFISLILFGCAMPTLNVEKVGQQVGGNFQSRIGETFFVREVMTGDDNGMGTVFNGEAKKIELVLTTATKDKLVLAYSEFQKPIPGRFGGYRRTAPWEKNPEFDRSFEFNLAQSDLIVFKQYKFKITSVNDGAVSYHRAE